MNRFAMSILRRDQFAQPRLANNTQPARKRRFWVRINHQHRSIVLASQQRGGTQCDFGGHHRRGQTGDQQRSRACAGALLLPTRQQLFQKSCDRRIFQIGMNIRFPGRNLRQSHFTRTAHNRPHLDLALMRCHAGTLAP